MFILKNTNVDAKPQQIEYQGPQQRLVFYSHVLPRSHVV
jgi:hypothetical protein